MNEGLLNILQSTQLYVESLTTFVRDNPDAEIDQCLTYIGSRLFDAIGAANQLEHEKQEAFDAGFRSAGGLIFEDPK